MKLAITLGVLAALACFGLSTARVVDREASKKAMIAFQRMLKSVSMKEGLSKEDDDDEGMLLSQGDDDGDNDMLLAQDDDDDGALVQKKKKKYADLPKHPLAIQKKNKDLPNHPGTVKAAAHYGAIQKYADAQGYWMHIPYWMWRHYWPFYYYSYYRYRALRMIYRGHY